MDLGLDSNIVKGQETQLIASLTSAPSLSLVLPFDLLFDGERGIFANPEKKGREWERPVSVELIYPPDFADEIGQESRHGHQDGFSVNAGVRSAGARMVVTHSTRNAHCVSIFADPTGPKILSTPCLEMRESMSSIRLTCGLKQIIPGRFMDHIITLSCGMCFPGTRSEIWDSRIPEAATIIYT